MSLRDPEDANIAIISVGGDAGFGAYVPYLDAFGVPRAIVADGPALRHNSKLAKQLGSLGYKPRSRPSPGFSPGVWLNGAPEWENAPDLGG